MMIVMLLLLLASTTSHVVSGSTTHAYGVSHQRQPYCIETERQALLTFKQGLVDADDALQSWTSNNKDCCTWKGISTTSHVVLGSSTHASMVSHQVQNYCIETERQALLTFKRGLMYAYGNPGEVLPSWTSNNKDCCTWKGISTTSHVVLGSSTHASMVSHQVQNYCIETERQALLTFKRGLMYAYGNPGEVLPSWTSNNKDCCTWKGIRFIFGDLFLENCSPE
ncbi:uncharacterized protein LOC133812412 isoform X2 [Humulus lupulus]|uniref:uncharacterized protein LOC133812412 isoform X2 n=1 Tax=Humulus lupulus TaxID=3486 RepID=UPI002B401C70|nr:uncharacterized protein LOC133812412 isoform X2 [Humulus lupulus]